MHDSGMRIEDVSVTTPLPKGWGSFCSRPDDKNPAHWYATAPYDADLVNDRHGLEGVSGLVQTVHAATWPELHVEVASQLSIVGKLSPVKKRRRAGDGHR